jgi:DNA-binding MarR family transcriptional regulator
METTGLEQMICFELYAASRAMTALYRPALDDAGLTYPQYLVMRVLWHRGPVTVRDLGQILHLDSGTLSPLLKRLETGGYLRRERGTADERTVFVHLTDAGTHLEQQVAQVPEQIICALDLNLDEYRQLHHLLGRIQAATPLGKDH